MATSERIFAVATLVIIILTPLAAVTNAKASGPSDIGVPGIPSTSLIPPAAPSEVGCYSYGTGDGWASTSCGSANSWQPPVPTEGGSGSAPVYGAQTTSGDVGSSYLDVYISAFSGEHDSSYGAGSFSIQLNTNYFNGNNGQSDWVQFAVQDTPQENSFLMAICEWEGNDYTLYRMNVASNSLFSGYTGYLNASVSDGNLEFTVGISTSTSHISYWSMSEPDLYGLASYWTSSSGTILGLGGGSQAVFGYPGQVDASVAISRFSSAEGGNFPGLTGETNNLNYNHESYTGCDGDDVCIENTTPIVPASPTISTSLSASSITAGQSVFDSATLSGETETAGGAVTYFYSTSDACPANSPKTVSMETVSDGTVPNSVLFAFGSAGSYYWYAVYSGDTYNNPATSPCELLTVNSSGGGGGGCVVTASMGVVGASDKVAVYFATHAIYFATLLGGLFGPFCPGGCEPC